MTNGAIGCTIIFMSNRLHNASITMDDIARELGLSKSTVSRALSDSGRISLETKERVKAFALEHGFKPNLVAKALAGKKTLNIAAVMPFEATALQMMFFHDCLSGIVSRSAREGYSVLVCMTGASDGNILERVLEDGKVDAVILTQLRHGDENVALLEKHGLPFVVIGSAKGEGILQVDSRMKENCRDFTLRCLEGAGKGARVLFVCANLDVEANNNRLSGFLAAMEAREDDSVHYAVCTDPSELGKEIMAQSWSLILCSDDVVCMNLLRILESCHIAVGGEVKVASFHDSILLESYGQGISALKVDAFKLGFAAAELSLKVLKGESYERVNYVDCSFQMRNSTH